MKTGIYTYLSFAGNCREAMHFYQQCLGGRLQLQRVGGSPQAEKLPRYMQEYILHAVLKKDGLVLMGSDMVMEDALVEGNAVMLMLQCRSEKELRNYYKKLSDGGKVMYPPQTNPSGMITGNIKDKYGHHWMLHFAGEGEKY
ncbi:MAG: VOC family protein [Bacteroidetes bacterium]|nr:VOC family protein [Bacteroidota bacterium]